MGYKSDAMILQIESHELKNLMLEMAELGAATMAKNLGIGPSDEISQREAFRCYGEARVKRWKREGKITRIKNGTGNSKAAYSRIELAALKKSESLNGIHK